MFTNCFLSDQRFTPTDKEFLDYNEYLLKVTKLNSKSGLALIKSPNIWKPSFNFDIFSKYCCKSKLIVTQDLKICKNDNPIVKTHLLTIDEFINNSEDLKREYFNKPPDLVTDFEIEKAFIENYFESNENINHFNIYRIYYYSRSNINFLECNKNFKLLNSIWNITKIQEHSIIKNMRESLDDSNTKFYSMLNNVKMEMCFTYKNWKQANYNSFILDYLIWGGSKTWFVISPEYSDQVKNIPLKLTTDFSSLNIPVLRIVQNAGDFILLQPDVYFCTLSHGANFAQRANYMPFEWLEFGLKSWISDKRSKWNFSFDELLINLMNSPDKFNEVTSSVHNIAKTLIKQEIELRRNLLVNGYISKKVKFKANRCYFCKTIYHLSYIGCDKCYGKKYNCCLKHTKSVENMIKCSCEEIKPYFNVNYTDEELLRLCDDFKPLSNKIINFNNTLDKQKNLKNDCSIHNSDINLNINDDIVKSLSRLSDYYVNLINSLLKDNCDDDDKLTYDQLISFVTKVQRHSNKLDLQDKLQKLKEKIKSSEEEILNLLKALPQKSKLEFYLKKYSVYPFEIPQIKSLILINDLLIWYEQATTSNLSSNFKERLASLQKGDSILLNLKMALSKILFVGDVDMVEQIEEFILENKKELEIYKNLEDRGNTFFNQEVELNDLEKFLEESSTYKDKILCIQKLEEALNLLRPWHLKVQSIMNEEPSPYVYVVYKLLREADNICVKSNKYLELTNKIKTADCWVKEAFKLFARSKSKTTLYEIIAPKIMSSTLIMKQPDNLTNKSSTLHQFYMGWNDPCYDPSPSLVVDTFKQAEMISVMNIKILRQKSDDKKSNNKHNCPICRQIKNYAFIKCVLCLNFCHELDSCSTTIHPASNSRLCLQCSYSNRPPLCDIYPLILSLQNIPLRVPEGEALQALVERVATWQSRVEEVLSSDICAPFIDHVVLNDPSDQTNNLVNKSFDLNGYITANIDDLESCMEKLNDLLIEAYIIEIYLDEIHSIERILNIYQTHDIVLQRKKLENIATTENLLTNCSTNKDIIINCKINKNVTNKNVSKNLATNKNLAVNYVTNDNAGINSMIAKNFIINSPTINNTNSNTNLGQNSLQPVPKSPFINQKKTKSEVLPQILDQTPPCLNSNSAKNDESISPQKSIVSPLNITLPDSFKQQPSSEAKTLARKDNKKVQKVTSKKTEETPKKLNNSNIQIVSTNNIVKPGNSIKISSPALTKFSPHSSNSKRFNKSSYSVVNKKFKSSSDNLEKKINDEDKSNVTIKKTGSKRKAKFEDEKYENCAANKCMKPSGSEVDWVMCDRCNKWFHLVCLNLKKSQIVEDEDFYCAKCRNK